MSSNKHIFSIEHITNEATGRPFGSTYAGEFTVRRRTLADKQAIAMREAARISLGGAVNPAHLAGDVVDNNYIFSQMDVIGEEKPSWFDLGKLYEGEDEQAIMAVWREVERWLNTFRPKADPQAGGN